MQAVNVRDSQGDWMVWLEELEGTLINAERVRDTGDLRRQFQREIIKATICFTSLAQGVATDHGGALGERARRACAMMINCVRLLRIAGALSDEQRNEALRAIDSLDRVRAGLVENNRPASQLVDDVEPTGIAVLEQRGAADRRRKKEASIEGLGRRAASDGGAAADDGDQQRRTGES